MNTKLGLCVCVTSIVMALLGCFFLNESGFICSLATVVAPSSSSTVNFYAPKVEPSDGTLKQPRLRGEQDPVISESVVRDNKVHELHLLISLCLLSCPRACAPLYEYVPASTHHLSFVVT